MKSVGMAVIRQVYETNFGQKLVTIPKGSDIVNEDFVIIRRVIPPKNNGVHPCQKCPKAYQDHTLKELYDHGLFGVKK